MLSDGDALDTGWVRGVVGWVGDRVRLGMIDFIHSFIYLPAISSVVDYHSSIFNYVGRTPTTRMENVIK